MNRFAETRNEFTHHDLIEKASRKQDPAKHPQEEDRQ